MCWRRTSSAGNAVSFGLAPEAIVLATGSGGTHAGRLVAGPGVAVDGRLYCWINFEMP
jgi:predicted DNA-binding protein